MTLFLDIETAADSLVCVGWAVDDGPLRSSPTLPQEVEALLADTHEVVVTHSGYDVRFLHFQCGVEVKAQMHDTQVMAWLVNENYPLDLRNLAQRYLGLDLDKTLQKQAASAPLADVMAYCEKDVDVTRQLYRVFQQRLVADGLDGYFDVVEAPFTKVLRDMEFRGLPVDLVETKLAGDAFHQAADRLEAKATQNLPAGFNLRAPQQVSRFLGSRKFTLKGKCRLDDPAYVLDADLAKLAAEPEFDVEKMDLGPIPPGSFVTLKEGRVYAHGVWVVAGHDPKGGIDTPLRTGVARPELLDNKKLATDPWVQTYLEFKKYDKLTSTYTDVFQDIARGGRIYGRFNQTGTTTGRLSSSNPNLQNIPARGAAGKQIRELFTGNLVVGDFSQLEPRLMAHFSQDPYMMDAFANALDLYQEIAARVGCDRGVAKVLVLAMSYGAGPDKVAQILHLNGFPQFDGRDARRLLGKLQEAYLVYFTWREKVIRDSKVRGYVETIDGRRRRVGSSGGVFNFKDPASAGRQAANAIVQGSAADIVRRVMLHTTRLFPELRLLAQVHDELVWEYDPAVVTDMPALLARLEKWVLKVAERGLTVPLVFEPHAGTSWYKAKEGI